MWSPGDTASVNVDAGSGVNCIKGWHHLCPEHEHGMKHGPIYAHAPPRSRVFCPNNFSILIVLMFRLIQRIPRVEVGDVYLVSNALDVV